MSRTAVAGSGMAPLAAVWLTACIFILDLRSVDRVVGTSTFIVSGAPPAAALRDPVRQDAQTLRASHPRGTDAALPILMLDPRGLPAGIRKRGDDE
jgi:hypothetical protein